MDKKQIQEKGKERTISQTVRMLSRRLEDSKEVVFNKLEPDFIEVDAFSKRRQKQQRGHNFPGNPPVEKEWTPEELDEIEKDLQRLSQYLKCTPVQAALFVGGFTCNINSENFDIDDIARYFDLPNIDFVVLQNDFGELKRLRIFEPYETHFSSGSFCISYSIKQAIYANEPMPDLKALEYTRYSFTQEIARYVESRNDGNKSTQNLMTDILMTEDKAQEIEFVQKVLAWKLDIETRTLFYDICADFVNSRLHNSDLEPTLRDIYDRIDKRFSVAGQLMNGKHILQEMGLVEVDSAEMLSDACIFLTEKGKKFFLEKDYSIFVKNESHKKLLTPQKIAAKKLFFDADLQKQLDFFERNLVDKQFKVLQKRLEAQALPKGLVALFHGAPGTGKTETVLQIAKRTGRSVYHVDITQAKSCWYGESQKLVKRIFTEYADMCKRERIKPILLFNEADALFSSRRDVSHDSGASSTEQTENSIQNILLEEMEKIDGIMIATSNLAKNLDSAFDRRFLFKIEFGQPSLEAKQAIWQSKLDWLSDENCKLLASKYDFSGGEIDNVVRKVTMAEVLNGEKPTMEELEDMCRHEKIGDKNKSIGFTR